MVNGIIDCFERKFNKFADTTDAFTYRFVRDEDSAIGTLCFNSFNVEFEYCLECGGIVEKSGLNIILDFSKRASAPLKCTMYDIIHLVDKNNFNCWFYCFIENESRMELCFDKLSSDFAEVFPKIREFANSPVRISQIENILAKNINATVGINIEQELSDVTQDDFENIIEDTYDYLYGMYFGYQQSSFATDEYRDFLAGNHKKALKRYEKKKKCLQYEEDIIEFMKNCDEPVPIISEEYECLKDGLKEYTSSRGFLPFFASWWILVIPYSALFVLLYFALSLIMHGSAVYATQLEPYNFMSAILPALVCSIASSYFLQDKICAKFFKKTYSRQKDYDAIFNGAKTRRRIGVFIYLVYILAVVATFLFANMGFSLSETGIRVNEDILDINGRCYTYNEIESVEHGDDITVNFDDGYSVGLYQFADEADIEENILPILEANGVKI